MRPAREWPPFLAHETLIADAGAAGIRTCSARLHEDKKLQTNFHLPNFIPSKMSGQLPRTMNFIDGREGHRAVRPYEYFFPPLGRALTEEDQNNNAVIINYLRQQRELLFRIRIFNVTFGLTPLRLAGTLPLPDPKLGSSETPWRMSMEHLQDFCNKSTVIYYKGSDLYYNFDPVFRFIFGHWLNHDRDTGGDIHKLDIEFARFFAKLVGIVDAQTTTREILNIHEALIKTSAAAHRSGFSKDDNRDHIRDRYFIGGQQTEFFKIKPLLRAIVIVIDNRVDNPYPVAKHDRDFLKQYVRLVRTGVTEGLSQPIAFDGGLAFIIRINENEVVTTFIEAIRFIMELDRKEGTLREQRDEKVLDHWLGLPEEQLTFNFSEFGTRELGIWTGTKEDIPVGPSTKWWKKEYEYKDILARRPGLTAGHIKRRNERREADRIQMGAQQN